MAYNRNYDPDALPRFAEPEARGGTPSASSQPPPQRFDKPPPPLPHQTQQVKQHSLNYGHASPPPTGGQRPPTHTRPPPQSRPPPTPSMDDSGSDPTLLPLFRAVDKNGTGQLSEKELSAALVNGDWTAFDPQTVRMMIRMFDSDRSGTIGFDEFCGLWSFLASWRTLFDRFDVDRSGSIGFDEFCGLWSFLASWRTLFDRFDVDRSGNISLNEFTDALVAFRYRLSPQFVELLFRTYDKRQEGVMSFDLFVQACISLKRMTDVFKKYDDDRDGYITLSFEDFLSEILKQMR